ncbi:50S ribosomal protein L25/general stress protein Ctc [Tannerella forsythia]|uniref:50S ribosomal protein L25/general stress protein Ctc n=1 Tax=Tannerella forsythia TaxID=28112 RepID=UPI00062B0BC1|nr:50S ribosomal protein L25/general stress protein Ctc [Tannerella forsythia]KKY60840.1 50S ribosomal protein L25 [Tannerella forsythia]PDP70949.1 50S ribosomal protein L25 [Tannerella forsythia]TPE16388.1 50S ribosomal protein L25/general stress protein Ctc [Tannerella forsythia]SCQ25273.1 50S ribosomal protein L25 [Tannerella forsythia]
MKTFELKGTPRENLGKKMSKNLRKQGMIPAVLYGQEPVALPYTGKMNAGEKLVEIGDGKGIIVTDFSVSFDGVRKLIYTPEIHLVSIEMGDGRKVNAILKEIQFHAVSDAILHLDFQEVFADKPIEMHVPVELIGHAVGVKAGGKLTQAMRKLKVKGLAEQIPEKLTVNVDHLELGKTIKVGELQFDHVELISPKNAVVCAVKMTRAAQSAAGAAAAAEK